MIDLNTIYRSDFPPIERVAVEASPTHWSNPVFRGGIAVLCVHAGNSIPTGFRLGSEYDQELRAAYCAEKDWGADLLAARIAGALGQDAFHRVNVARVLMDFGRFPGVTEVDDHMHRFALSGLFSKALDRHQQRDVLENCYDPISAYTEELIWPQSADHGKVMLLSIHTYDVRNPTPPRTIRPHISLLHTPLGYGREKRMPFHVFDPAYPDRLAEATADPKLVSRLALQFSSLSMTEHRKWLGSRWSDRFRVGFNHPYHLPDGSIEVRAQVWSFFRFVRQRFEAGHPDCTGPVFDAVWRMLFDTNLRDASTGALRSYLHMLRNPHEQWLEDADRAYQRIVDFIAADYGEVIEEYRHTPTRLSAMVLEVRKDLVWPFRNGKLVPSDAPRQRHLAAMDFIAHNIARAVHHFIEEDSRSNDDWAVRE